MIRRREVGRFKRSKLGGWEGEIETLTIQRKLRFVPNDNQVSDNSPAFRVMLGWKVIGEAWEKQIRTDPPRDFLRVRIDDPLCPISAALFPDAEGLTARMIMNFPVTNPSARKSENQERCRDQREEADDGG